MYRKFHPTLKNNLGISRLWIFFRALYYGQLYARQALDGTMSFADIENVINMKDQSFENRI
jgi:hypothetical protein